MRLVNIYRLLESPESLLLHLNQSSVIYDFIFYCASFTFLKNLSVLRRLPINFNFYLFSEVSDYKYPMTVFKSPKPSLEDSLLSHVAGS